MKKVLIDTDMGYDDILAICMLLLSSKVKILGISLVDGVSKTKKGFLNLRRILTYLDEEISILTLPYKSPKNPVSFPKSDTKRAENLTLLKNLDIPRLKTNKTLSDLEVIFKNLRPKEKLTLLALGPLTNVTWIIKRYPNKIKQIIFMGGGLFKGNIPPRYIAEYNVALDPNAANQVFNSEIPIPITMVGIDATSSTPATEEFKNKVTQTKAKNKKSQIIKEIIINNRRDFEAFYDSLAAAILIDFKVITKKANFSIKVSEEGQTIPVKNEKVEVVLKVNSDKFYKYLLKLIENDTLKENL